MRRILGVIVSLDFGIDQRRNCFRVATTAARRTINGSNRTIGSELLLLLLLLLMLSVAVLRRSRAGDAVMHLQVSG